PVPDQPAQDARYARGGTVRSVVRLATLACAVRGARRAARRTPHCAPRTARIAPLRYQLREDARLPERLKEDDAGGGRGDAEDDMGREVADHPPPSARGNDAGEDLRDPGECAQP